MAPLDAGIVPSLLVVRITFPHMFLVIACAVSINPGITYDSRVLNLWKIHDGSGGALLARPERLLNRDLEQQPCDREHRDHLRCGVRLLKRCALRAWHRSPKRPLLAAAECTFPSLTRNVGCRFSPFWIAGGGLFLEILGRDGVSFKIGEYCCHFVMCEVHLTAKNREHVKSPYAQVTGSDDVRQGGGYCLPYVERAYQVRVQPNLRSE